MAETYHVITTWQVQLYCVERSETSQYGFFEISYEKRSWYCISLLDHVTHRTQRGVGETSSPQKFPFPGAARATSAPRPEKKGSRPAASRPIGPLFA